MTTPALAELRHLGIAHRLTPAALYDLADVYTERATRTGDRAHFAEAHEIQNAAAIVTRYARTRWDREAAHERTAARARLQAARFQDDPGDEAPEFPDGEFGAPFQDDEPYIPTGAYEMSDAEINHRMAALHEAAGDFDVIGEMGGE